MNLKETLGWIFGWVGLFGFMVCFFLKPSLLSASLDLSMKAMICFLAEFPKEMKLLQLARLSAGLPCLRVTEIFQPSG